MKKHFLLYGATGFLGKHIAAEAIKKGIQPILAGRNEEKLKSQASDLNVEYRVLNLDDHKSIDSALEGVTTILSCAGPFIHTFKPIVEACLRNGKNYLDITGELPVFEAVFSYDSQAKSKGIMLLPGAGFDVLPTDCLASHLKKRLPSATHLTLAFYSQGPAGLPPGTQRTVIEMISYGDRICVNGKLEKPPSGIKTRMMDFGHGPVSATRITWGDVFMAHLSTGIPNIEDYAVLPASMQKQMAMVSSFRSLFKLRLIQNLLKAGIKPGPDDDLLAKTTMSVRGEVTDESGRKAVSLLHGPEAGVIWTTEAALAVLKNVLDGNISAGFQTPAKAYGPDIVMTNKNVTRVDVE